MVDVEASPLPIPDSEVLKNRQILSQSEMIYGGWLWLGILEVKEKRRSWSPEPPPVHAFWSFDLVRQEHLGSGMDYHNSGRWVSVSERGDLRVIDIAQGSQILDDHNIREILGWGKCLVTRAGWLVDFYYRYKEINPASVRIDRRLVKPPVSKNSALSVVRIDLVAGENEQDMVVIDWRTGRMLPKEILLS